MVTKMRGYRFLISILVLLGLLLSGNASSAVSAQTYLFSLSEYEVEAYLQEDGSLTLYYYMVFDNDPRADPIEFVDLGLPVAQYDLKKIEATINDKTIPKIGSSAYVEGAELALGDFAIQPGQSGTVIVWVRDIKNVLFEYDQPDRENYINFQFSPNYFGSEYDKSTSTKYRMTIVLPPGVGANDGIYYAPVGWPGEDITESALTTDNRVYYSWYTENADVHTQYYFGVAFPSSAVPAESIITKDTYEQKPSSGKSGSFFDTILEFLPCCIVFFAVAGSMIIAIVKNLKNSDKRKMQYMPPKISIEGQGIKRGLTAVESGILMEEPLDKVFTMILFGLLKKEAVTVLEKDPLKIKKTEPLPEGLYDYEMDFLKAFDAEDTKARKRELQTAIINLVNSVTLKMKGFSKAETINYYKEIVKRAWNAVEQAQTPEIKSAQFDTTLEWTMLDKEFNQKTDRTFSSGPVIIPRWWPRYDPSYRPIIGTGAGSGAPVSIGSGPSSGSGTPSLSLPHIPGSDFAASMVNGASTMAASALGDVAGFTGGITNKTNPIPIPTSTPRSGGGGFRGGGGGHSCACACACAGCACACAGGGR